MKRQWPPTPDVVLPDLAAVSELLYSSLDAGCDRALRHFEQDHAEPIDPWLHANIARHYGRRYLTAHDIDVTGFKVLPVSFSGIYLRSDTIDARVLKIAHHHDSVSGETSRGIQARGLSRARIRYYNQPLRFYEEGIPEGWAQLAPTRVKLVVLWATDEDYQLSELTVACPKLFNRRLQKVETHWIVRLPRGFTVDLVSGVEPITVDSLLPELEFEYEMPEQSAASDDA